VVDDVITGDPRHWCVEWGIPTHSIKRSITHLVLHVKCPVVVRSETKFGCADKI
jgi:hypothetical protein